MPSIYYLYHIIILISGVASWHYSNVNLPESKSDMLMGYNSEQQIVYLFGGTNDNEASSDNIWKWDMKESQEFIIIDETTPSPVVSNIQSSVTVQNRFVYIYNNAANIFVFDMEEELFINSSDITSNIPLTNCRGSCLTANTTHLFLIGGNGCDVMQIYDIDTNKWYLQYLPAGETQFGFGYGFCITTDDALYIMGGNDGSNNPSTFYTLTYKYIFNKDEWFYVTNQQNQSCCNWSTYSNQLNRIYNVGGEFPTISNIYNIPTVNVFDVDIQRFIGYDIMLDRVEGAPALIVDNEIMVFGGKTFIAPFEWNYYSTIQTATLPLLPSHN